MAPGVCRPPSLYCPLIQATIADRHRPEVQGRGAAGSVPGENPLPGSQTAVSPLCSHVEEGAGGSLGPSCESANLIHALGTSQRPRLLTPSPGGWDLARGFGETRTFSPYPAAYVCPRTTASSSAMTGTVRLPVYSHLSPLGSDLSKFYVTAFRPRSTEPLCTFWLRADSVLCPCNRNYVY